MAAAVAGAILALPAVPVAAQGKGDEWPSRPIRLIVPFTPGTLDVLARSIGQKLNERYGQHMVVDNRPGAGTIVGTEIASKARPDGYTLLMITTTFVINPSLHPKLPYDPDRQFVPVTQVDAIYNILVSSPTFPANSIAELIALAKAKPGQFTYASAGVGTAPMISAELFKLMTGTDITHVPYKGIPEAITDIIGGRVHMLMTTTASAAPHITAGRVRALAVTSPKRLPHLPQVATVGETVPGYEADAFRGIMAPAGLPPALLRRISGDIAAAVKSPEINERLVFDGGVVIASTPEAFGAFLVAQRAKWGKVIRDANIKPQ
jgi:tripartite-type tricarboxylate transporter receptor subunit TctC